MTRPILITVRCPADGVVAVTARDLAQVVIRSGSDVRAAFRCPRCGSPLLYTSDPDPSLLEWVLRRVREASPMGVSPDAMGEGSPLTSSDDAHIEYFRRELEAADTVSQMLALMDVAERPSGRAAGRRS